MKEKTPVSELTSNDLIRYFQYFADLIGGESEWCGLDSIHAKQTIRKILDEVEND